MASSAAPMDPAQAAQLAALQRQLRDQIHTWLGTSEFGVIVASVFYGINIIQLYTYASTRERRDPLWIRSLIAWVWCLDTAHTGLIWTWLFDKTVLDAADPTKIVNLFDMTDALILSVVFSGFIGASVQSFYAYRINRLAGHPWFSIPAYIGSAVRAALSVAIAVFGKQAKTLIVFTVMYPWAIHGVLGASVAVDLFNTILTCILLARQRDGLKQTAGMISKMTVWTIENGLLTTLCPRSSARLRQAVLLLASRHVELAREAAAGDLYDAAKRHAEHWQDRRFEPVASSLHRCLLTA
ncbi:hypothetical protein EXIGLDRAFT_278918 [Exidia glandulosa HHB12029]|uniref:DUF6534 domain-containing protein n=1 Tax=Exidia glandulosa HHB12029 TaxID=1314781 RepID=A0A165DJY4_EXIGL|nr:hypothetical protein EXIGLDRAFT_278918 [Exidia glandulosa HHB12029]